MSFFTWPVRAALVALYLHFYTVISFIKYKWIYNIFIIGIYRNWKAVNGHCSNQFINT